MACNSTYWVLHHLPDLYWRPVMGSVVIIISILSIIENGIILLVFYHYPAVRTSSNKILLSMATADFFTGLILGPLYGSYLFQDKMVVECISNELRRYFATLFLGASSLAVGILSIDRSFHLRKLQKYRLPNKILYSVLFLNWFLPISVPLIGLVNSQVYAMVIFVFAAAVVIVVIVAYILLIISLKRYSRSITEQMRARVAAREKSAGMTVIVIVTCYIVMLLPLLIEKLLFAVKYFSVDDGSERAKFMMIGHVVCTANSVVNPCIYVNRVADLRNHTIKMLRIRTRSEIKEKRLEMAAVSSAVISDR